MKMQYIEQMHVRTRSYDTSYLLHLPDEGSLLGHRGRQRVCVHTAAVLGN